MMNIFYGFLIISVIRHLIRLKSLLTDREGFVVFVYYIPFLWILGFIFNKITYFI